MPMKPYDDCVYCGGLVEERLERIDYRYHGQLFILEQVLTGVCIQCGERYFKSTIAKRMEEMASKADSSVRAVAIRILFL